MAEKEVWGSEIEEGLPEDQQVLQSGAWEDEATREAKYSRVKAEGDAPSTETVDDGEADSLSETVVTAPVSLDQEYGRTVPLKITLQE